MVSSSIKYLARSNTLALAILFLAVFVSAQVPRATDTGFGGANQLNGLVLLPSGQPGGRVRIRISSQTRGDRIAMTDENGHFLISGLPSGDYQISIDKEDRFKTSTQQLSVIQMAGAPPQTYYMNIRLEYKEGTDAAPGVINAQFADVPKSALEMYTKGNELAGASDHRGAIEQFQLAVAEYPQFMLAYNEMGVQYLRLHEFQKADEALQAALKIKPDAFAPMMNRGMVLFYMKRYSEAEPLLRKAVETEPDQPAGHFFFGQTLANLGFFDNAEKELLIALKSGSAEMKEGHRILAIIYNSRGDKKRAVAQIEAYLRLAPDAPDAEQLRALVKQLKGSK